MEKRIQFAQGARPDLSNGAVIVYQPVAAGLSPQYDARNSTPLAYLKGESKFRLQTNWFTS